ncbi:hypothetical protein [Rhizobium ruizarguesonis]|uniref:hypothetical protein n=1 Tax=Rhizobium ruizarguesonis TaxID=2081791 RepID=UPI001030C866|nr:hypothetical protein [Rhizobium ruizarguesonis]TAY81982.1 hypothetical protein ELH86_24875 [Rhizobium ruizarguesonis]
MANSVIQILSASFVMGFTAPALARSPEENLRIHTEAVKQASAIFFVAAFLDKCSTDDPRSQSELDAKADRMRHAIWKITDGKREQFDAVLSEAYAKIRQAEWLIRCNMPANKLWGAAEESLQILDRIADEK